MRKYRGRLLSGRFHFLYPSMSFWGATVISVILRGLFLDRFVDKTYRKKGQNYFVIDV